MPLPGKSLLAMVIGIVVLPLVTVGPAHASGDLYAAIAVGNHHVGEAADYPNQFAADQAALQSCEKGVVLSCTIKARIRNACGSVVERDVRGLLGPAPEYFVGVGFTAAAAQQDARLRVDWDTKIILEVTKPAFVLDTVCTSNIR